MGTCYSSLGRGSNTEEEVDGWWKYKNNRTSKKAGLDSKSKLSFPGDFVSFVGKFGGGGATAYERALFQIPGRLFANGHTSIVSLFTQQGKKGTNQDAMIVWENFSSRADTVFCGVFDGHGPYGHMVAKKVRDSLPVLLCSQWEANSNYARSEEGNATRISKFEEVVDDEWCESLEVKENEELPKMYLPLKKSMLKAFKLMDKDLKFHSAMDCFCSGTTAVALVKQGQDLIIGNVGDSRAVLATRDNNSLTAVQLTVDLKPNLPREAARIEQCKGRVFALQDEPEVARVWLPDSNSPGLAMARAFGDFCLKDFGLISVPDVNYRHLTQKDEFIVLASDGVWDVLSNKEAVDIIASAPNRATASRALVDCATRAWRFKYPTSKIDDCAVVCLFLEHVPPSDAAATAQEDHLMKDTEPVAKSISSSSVMNGGNARSSDIGGVSAVGACVTEQSGNSKDAGEIVSIVDSTAEKLPERGLLGQSTRSLAECISTAEEDEEEWSALEGITRVNSLLSIPRFLSGDKISGNWRNWL